MKTKITFLLILIIIIIGGCGETDTFQEQINNNEIGLCYRRDIKAEELGFLNHNPSKQEVIERLGYPLMSLSIKENGKVIEYLYDYSVDSNGYKPITISFDSNYNFKAVSTKGEISIENINDIKEYDKAKYYIKIRYDIQKEDLDFVKEGITSDIVQKELGAPHAYLNKIMSNNTYAPDIASNIFMYKLQDGDILYFRYANLGDVNKAGYMDENFNYKNVIFDILAS